MQTFKIGDTVAVLHDTIKGKIVELSTASIKMEDEDGFIRSYPHHKIVLQQPKKDYKIESKIVTKDRIIKPILAKNTIVKNIATVATEIDLHIEELMDYTTHLANFEIVQIQMTACRAFVQDAIATRLKKIVVIHGKGEGVLKSEIHQYLDRLSNNRGVQLDYHDAPYNQYGMGGATTISFYGH
ncbi:MAG: dsDNA-specific endonuclease/ATPase MutS2 [Crocinitomix sp.]|jgi:dsDNA-specific endonuclease/ATPase MutS2